MTHFTFFLFKTYSASINNDTNQQLTWTILAISSFIMNEGGFFSKLHPLATIATASEIGFTGEGASMKLYY